MDHFPPLDVSKLQRLGTHLHLQRCMGRGAFGEVFEAVDDRTGQRVAVKLLHRLTPANLARFEKEFRSLQDLSSPHLVSLQDTTPRGFVAPDANTIHRIRGVANEVHDNLLELRPA